MGKSPVDSPVTDSCRLDWLSLSYFAATPELQARQLAFFDEVLRKVVTDPLYKDGGGRQFFENSVFHDAGVALRWSAPDGAKNPGHLSVDLRGEFFKLATPQLRSAVVLDAAGFEGFRHCTRLDAQRTIVEPQADAEQVHRMVVNRDVWVARHNSYRQLGPTDSKGEAIKGASVVWGGPQSAVRNMTYNKALEDKWGDVRAVRHETKLLKQPARDSFMALVNLLEEEEGPTNKFLAEIRFAQSVLAKHMTYLDTSRLAGIPDKKDWPENWVRDSQPAPFWSEVVEGTPIELTTTWRAEKSLEDSQAACNTQYGRKSSKYVMWRVYGCGEDRLAVLDDLFSAWCSRLKDEDLGELLSMCPEEVHEDLVRDFREWREAAAHNLEGFARKDPIGGKNTPEL